MMQHSYCREEEQECSSTQVRDQGWHLEVFNDGSCLLTTVRVA